jgi:DNA-3-methyladenine glycosylase
MGPETAARSPFPRALLAADTETAARRVIGAHLIRGGGPVELAARIIEVEAYIGPDDLASHARSGRTMRNAVMFGPPGVAYVYLVYGMYHCLNVVTEAEGLAAALLIRAVEPTAGAEEMRAARLRWVENRRRREGGAEAQFVRRRIEALPAAHLASGPGLVCAAFSIDRTDDGRDLCDPASNLRLELWTDDEPLPVATGPRVGIDYAPEPWRSRPWRFFVPGNPSLSSASRHARRGRRRVES